MSDRSTHLWGEIDDKLTYSFLQEFNEFVTEGKAPISILIHSYGGDLDCETIIIDEIESAKQAGIQISTIALGVAFSAAGSILAMGTKGLRYARPNASVMLHPCSYHLESDYAGNQQNSLNFINRRIDTMNRIIAKACGMSRRYGQFLNDIDKGLWLNSKEAIKYGVIDGIWKKPIPFGNTVIANAETCE